MQLYVGTSGYSYPEWKGNFYPDDLPASEMLASYAARLPAVEVNNTFYRMPKSTVVQQWAEEVPDEFRFVIKASRRITHQARLAGTEESVGFLLRSLAHLGPKLGAVLLQLPPFLRADLDRLRGFLETWPREVPATIEFRHRSWFEQSDTEALLREFGVAWCVRDADDGSAPETLPATAEWGVLRLRHTEYTDDQLQAWADLVARQSWRSAYVFFKHDEGCEGPELAARFARLFGADRSLRWSEGRRDAPDVRTPEKDVG